MNEVNEWIESWTGMPVIVIKERGTIHTQCIYLNLCTHLRNMSVGPPVWIYIIFKHT